MTMSQSNSPKASARHPRSWIFYATLLVIFWGVWGAFWPCPPPGTATPTR